MQWGSGSVVLRLQFKQGGIFIGKGVVYSEQGGGLGEQGLYPFLSRQGWPGNCHGAKGCDLQYA